MFSNDFYPFEPPDATRLALIPLRVRYKLDCAGVRLRLAQWQGMTSEQKMRLLQLPVATSDDLDEYRRVLSRLVGQQGESLIADEPGAGKEEWRNLHAWPGVVVRQCAMQGLPLPPLHHWQALAEPDRHALFVLARSNHSQQEFLAALALFCER